MTEVQENRKQTEMWYERGLMCVGRRVRVHGDWASGHARTGTLLRATKKGGVVKIDGRAQEEFARWENIHYWISGNNGVLPEPSSMWMPSQAVEAKPTKTGHAVPELTAMENRDMKAMDEAAAKSTEAEKLRKIAKEAEVVSLGDVGARLRMAMEEIEQAERDVKDARAMLAEANRKHAERLAELRGIRKDVAGVLSSIDSMIQPN